MRHAGVLGPVAMVGPIDLPGILGYGQADVRLCADYRFGSPGVPVGFGVLEAGATDVDGTVDRGWWAAGDCVETVLAEVIYVCRIPVRVARPCNVL